MTARFRIAADSPASAIDRRLFGSFVEHLGRAVYTGIYEPGHPTATPDGFRGDVLDLTRELGVTTVRYPGGNFVSSYRWEDGAGPVAERPRRLDLAWHSLETNEVGTNEFMAWCAVAGVEPMMAVNIGTRGTEAALDLLEYCNHPSGTALSDLRRAHGVEAPHGVKVWCLGNEMDGPWQVGHMAPAEYARAARELAHAMKLVDSTLELVACGSSSRSMPTFGEWERAVITEAFDHIDMISAHAYYEEHDGDLASFLASATDMDAFITEVAAVADEVSAGKGSDKRIHISFDEWNVWYMTRTPAQMPTDWPIAPRLLEDVYSVADAVVVGDLLITLLRHADRVRAASLAQLVNVIGPIMTEPGGPAWRQTTFFPFSLTAQNAGAEVVAADVEAPTVPTARHGDAPVVNAVATRDAAGVLTVFAVNRDTAAARPLEIVLDGLGGVGAATATVLHDADPYAANTRENPERVAPAPLAVTVDGAVATAELPPVSWAMIRAEPA